MDLVDHAYQRLYTGAYRVMKLWWKIRRPHTHGALVLIWHKGQVLLVKQSYLDYLSAPGGYVKSGETARDAALRELEEELNLQLMPEQLTLTVDVKHEWNEHLDHVEIFEVELDTRPEVHVDNREVVQADFFTPEAALEQNVFPPIRAAIEKRRLAMSQSTRA